MKLPPPGFKQPIPDPPPPKSEMRKLIDAGLPECTCTGPHWVYFGRCETCGGYEE